jgi:magnesium chelatase subunit ChlD-like protein
LARLHWPRTLLAKGPVPLAADHLRWAVAEAPGQRLHCIVLDGSGSMRRHGGFAAARALAQGLVAEAARRREQLAVLSLNGGRVTLLAAPQPARRSTVARLATLGSGGGTPVSEALAAADRLLVRARRQQPALHTCLWLLTDGRTLDVPSRPVAATSVVVVDFDRGDSRAPGRAADWAEAWGAEYLSPDIPRR